MPILAPASTNNLSNMLFQSTFDDRVPGVPLFTQNLNCHCFDPNKTFVLNPAAWVNPPAGQFGTAAPTTAIIGTSAGPRRTWAWAACSGSGRE